MFFRCGLSYYSNGILSWIQGFRLNWSSKLAQLFHSSMDRFCRQGEESGADPCAGEVCCERELAVKTGSDRGESLESRCSILSGPRP